MAQPGSIIGKIGEELGELGKKVASETAKVPTDIAGKALESLGSAKAGKPTSEPSDVMKGPKEKTPVEKLDETKDQKQKQQIARRALEWMAGRRAKQKKLGVGEMIVLEREQKKKLAQKEEKKRDFEKLPLIKGKLKPGAYFSAKQQAGSETSRNVRSD